MGKQVRSVCLLVFSSAMLFGQGERGAITGLITDPTGAVIPAAKVTAVNQQTNVESSAIATQAGVYRIPYLPPGNYEVSASAPGFKRAVVSPVAVTVAGVITADLKLEVGNTTESVTVSADATLLESSTSETGRSINSAEFHTWPIAVDDGQRQLQSFIFRSLPGAVGEPWEGSINGGQKFSHEVLIEGMSLGRFDINGGANAEFSPSADAVNEFKLQSGTLGAQYGGTQTSVANFNIRSGTNQFHGTAYEYFRNDVLNARGFNANALGTQKPPYRENSFGGTFGGPVRIPKIYNGQNKTFFFFNYEGDRRRQYSVGALRTLPTVEFKRGDFSRLLDPAYTGDNRSGTAVGQDPLGRPVVFGAVYDPASTRTVGGKLVRDPFPGNIIPQGRFSKVSANILTQAPIPDPVIGTFLRNYPGTAGQPVFTLNDYGGKLDHVFSVAHRAAFFANFNERIRYNGAGRSYVPIPGSASGPYALQTVNGTILRLTEDWVIRPTLLNHFGIGFNRFINYNNTVSLNQDWPAKLGLAGAAPTHFPQIQWGGTPVQGSTLTQLGRNTAGVGANGSTIVQNDTTWLRGKHSFKFGTEIRKYFYNERPGGNASGTYFFYPDQTAEPNFRGSTGFSFASFLLGSVRSSSQNVFTTSPGHRVWYPAFYGSDDWRVSSTLTLNLGLRWEIAGALYEVANRISGLDPTLPNPGADGYPGAVVFLSDIGRSSFQDRNMKQFAPRVGFAWQLHSRSVLRGGYGINYSAPINNGFGFDDVFGFNGTNNYPARPPNAVFNWDSGYPPFKTRLPDKRPDVANGDYTTYTPRDSTRQPYVQNWSLGFQFLLPSNMVVDASYVGNKGTRLNNYSFGNLQQVHPKYLALGDALLDNINDHPEIPKPYPSFDDTVAQALRPYPQYYGNTDLFPHAGNSFYHAFQLQATRRMTSGLSVLLAYTFSKAISDSDDALQGNLVGAQDVYNRRLERSVTSFNYPNDFKLTWVYEFPLGKGKRFLNSGGVVNALLGNWMVTGIHHYVSGNPLSISTDIDASSVLFNGSIRGDVVPGAAAVKDAGGLDFVNGTPYLNPAAFSRPPTTENGVPLRLGTAPRYLPNVRGPMRMTEDFGLLKRFAFGEARNFEIRADFFNAFNRAGRGDPDTDFDSPTFGRILGPQQGPRSIQLEARISF